MVAPLARALRVSSLVESVQATLTGVKFKLEHQAHKVSPTPGFTRQKLPSTLAPVPTTWSGPGDLPAQPWLPASAPP